MFLWVLPNNQNSNQEHNREIGTVTGGKLMSNDLINAENEIHLLQELAFTAYRHAGDDPLKSPTGPRDILMMLGYRDNSRGWLAHDSKLHYALLQREATMMGISVSEAEAQAYFDAQLPMTPTELRSIQQYFRTEWPGISHVLRKFLAVKKLADQSLEAVAVSLPEVEHNIVDRYTFVAVQYAAMDASKGFESMPAPAAEDVAKQFEAYKEILPEDAVSKPTEINGHKFPFGYKLPDRVGIEYLTIHFEDARRICEPHTSLEKINDQLEAFKEFSLAFEAGEFDDKPATSPATTSAPATATAPATSAPATATAPATADRSVANRDKKWEANRQKYLDMQIDKRARSKVKEIAEHAAARSRQLWTDETGSSYKKPLDPKMWAKYADLAADISKQYGVKVEAKVAKSPGGNTLLTRKELDGIEKLGSAVYRRSNGDTFKLSELAMQVKPLDPEPKGISAQLLLQLGVEGPVFIDDEENHDAYVYRVSEVDAAHVPTKENEVNDAKRSAAQDLQRVALFNKYRGEAQEIEMKAISKGIAAAAAEKQFKTKTTSYFPRLFIRDRQGAMLAEVRSPYIDETVGATPAFVNKAFELAGKLPGRVAGATSQPSNQLVASTPVGSVAVEEKLSVYVMQVDGYEPVTKSIYKTYGPSEAFQLIGARQGAFLQEWINIKQVAKRVGYKTLEGKELESE
jgi:hypothetical protein